MRLNIFPSFYLVNFRLEFFDIMFLDEDLYLLSDVSFIVAVDVIHSQG